MPDQDDAVRLIRADLTQRLRQLDQAGGCTGPDFCASVHAIRRLAMLHGLTAVARIAEALEEAGGSRRAVPGTTRLYVERLHDALALPIGDERAAQAMLASIAVRLHG